MASFSPIGLLKSHGLYASYLRAQDPKLRESATVPLWENLFNKEICEGNNDLFVNSQQPTDDTTRAADDVIQYYDQAYNPVIVLVVEMKRRKKKGKAIVDMEDQLNGYMQFFFESYKGGGGLARRDFAYGAVAYGTKIRG